MVYAFQTADFEYEYIESVIETTALWESHCHARFEMIAVLEGSIRVMLEGRSYRVGEGQTILIPPLSYHAVTAKKQGAYRRITSLFDPTAIPDVLQEQFLQKNAVSLAHSPQIADLKKICKEPNPQFYAPLANSLMIQILYDHAGTESVGTTFGDDDFLQPILSYIEEHLCEKITLDELARHVSRSKSSVCHLFEKKMNISPKQYILQKKMALSAKRIHDGVPPTLAAAQIGYENYSDFYRMYQKHFGTSPAKTEG